MTKPPTFRSSQRQDVRVQQAVVNDHDLDQQRCPAEDPDVDIGHPANRPEPRQPAERPEDAEDDAYELAGDGDRDRQQQTLDDAGVRAEQRVEEDVPVVLICGGSARTGTRLDYEGNGKQPAERERSAGCLIGRKKSPQLRACRSGGAGRRRHLWRVHDVCRDCAALDWYLVRTAW